MIGEVQPVLSFEEFTARLTLLVGRDADDIRARYIAHFVDTTTTYYREHIARLSPHSDGLSYDGYLWDSLAEGRQVTENEVRGVELLDHTVGVFWDLHSRDKIWTPAGTYWRFPKRAVLQLQHRDLLAGQAYLPTDLYIFDPAMSWTLVFTHEWDAFDQRIYLRAP
jgi:hypothetical protein